MYTAIPLPRPSIDRSIPVFYNPPILHSKYSPLAVREPVVSRDSKEEILQELTEKAIALFGQERAEALRASLEQTATYLLEIGQADLGTEVEPGFFQ